MRAAPGKDAGDGLEYPPARLRPSPEVGSSAIKSRGPKTKPIASMTNCLMPPLNLKGVLTHDASGVRHPHLVQYLLGHIIGHPWCHVGVQADDLLNLVAHQVEGVQRQPGVLKYE